MNQIMTVEKIKETLGHQGYEMKSDYPKTKKRKEALDHHWQWITVILLNS